MAVKILEEQLPCTCPCECDDLTDLLSDTKGPICGCCWADCPDKHPEVE